MTGARELLDAVRAELAAAAVPQEALGRHAAPGRLLRRAPRIERAGSAWRLGVLLLTSDGDVLGVGEVVRAVEDARRGYAAVSARARAEEGAAAVRGGFQPGETVHVGWTALDLDAVERGEASGPLLVADGVPMVRWSRTGAPAPLDAYVRERVDLLKHPPEPA
ncbi:MAG: glutaminase [Microbacterium sp.]|uniref:glutaminase n=1 Tax=Microbacterium sp. TaxID=51671 RepID=UPI0039E3CA0E